MVPRHHIMKKIHVPPVIVFCALIVLGIFYRLFLGSMTESRLVWDEVVYVDMARRILSGQLASDCCTHGPGYSLFLALVFFFTGEGNLFGVKLVQAVVDTLTGVLLYITAKRVFGRKTACSHFLSFKKSIRLSIFSLS